VSPVIELLENKGMKTKDVKKALSIIELYKSEIMAAWIMYFDE
jgi:hypothetical protein